MAQRYNYLEKFWQELKRRKVFKVVALYAGTAFIILQLFDIIAQPLQLPAWTMTLVIVLLCIGFIITLLIAWIYDITPEGIKKTESVGPSGKRKSKSIPVKRGINGSNIIISVMAIVIVILLYPKIFNRDKLRKIKDVDERISIAIMPFQNMTNDTTWNIWQDGIQDLLITSLSNQEELKIRQGESTKSLINGIGITNYASITPSVASEISKKLDASIFIFGSIKTAGLIIRVNAQLINSESEEVYKSFEIDGPSREEMIFNIVDSLRNQIKNFIIISVLKKKVSPDIQPYTFTNSPDAYRFFIHGRDAYNKSDFQTAFNLLSQSVAIDSNFVFANIMLSWTYFYLEGVKQAKDCFLRTYKNRNLMPLKVRIFADYTYALYSTTPDDAIKCLRQLQEIDDRDPSVYFYLGNRYNDLLQPERAIPEYEKALEIYNDLGSRPSYSHNYVFLGMAYHKTGQYKKEAILYKRAAQDFPDNPELLSRQIILSFTVGDTVRANQYIDKYKSFLKNNSSTEATTLSNLATIYSEASILDKAEEYYREALSSEPENLYGLYNLARFLIDKDRNINEGLELIDKALALFPDNYLLLNIKGWGLYKQDKFKEALDILENSWNLKPSYDHGIFLHLEAAKKAFANQRNN